MTDEKFDWRLQYMPWVVLGFIFVIIDYFVVTPQSVDFPTGITYATSAWIIALMMYETARESPNYIGMLVGAFLGCLPIMIGLGLDPTLAMTVGFLGIFAVYYLLNQKRIGEKLEQATFFTLVPMFIWLVWSFMYIQQRLHDPALLPFQTLIYHGSLLLFAGWSIYRFFNIPKDDEQAAKISYALLASALIGMLLVTQGLGWGLRTI